VLLLLLLLLCRHSVWLRAVGAQMVDARHTLAKHTDTSYTYACPAARVQ
jgi:hypothetical protein